MAEIIMIKANMIGNTEPVLKSVVNPSAFMFLTLRSGNNPKREIPRQLNTA